MPVLCTGIAALASAALLAAAPPPAVKSKVASPPHAAGAAPVAQKGHPSKVTRPAAKRAHGKSAHWVHRDDAPATSQRPGAVNESIRITPFPSQAAATKRALSQNRRDVLDDAEKAARASAMNDRWQTVLFDLRDIDARSDPEGCFWRLVAYYRLGEVQRAREIRDKCELPPRDLAMLEAEDAQAASMQPPMALAEIDHPPPPVANPAPYAGAAPTRLDR
jgi:hypothetical protein